MARYRIITLVDITKSNPSRTETDKIKIGQQSNFNSLIQAIGLRANISWVKDPSVDTGSLPQPWKGKASYWTWEFDTERVDEFLKGSNPVELLIDDLHGVPVIENLTNTADINPAAFQSKGDNLNIVVEII